MVNEKTRPGGVLAYTFRTLGKPLQAFPQLRFRYDRTFIPPYGTTDTIGQHGGIETGDMNFNDGTYVLQKYHRLAVCAVSRRAFPICAMQTKPDSASWHATAHVVVDARGKIAHDTLTNLGPRIGFAYRLGKRRSFGPPVEFSTITGLR